MNKETIRKLMFSENSDDILLGLEYLNDCNMQDIESIFPEMHPIEHLTVSERFIPYPQKDRSFDGFREYFVNNQEVYLYIYSDYIGVSSKEPTNGISIKKI